MSDVDKLIELAKQGPLTYDDAMMLVQSNSLDCAPSVILEVCCLSRGWDCGALSYLFGVVTSTREEGESLIVSRYESRAVRYRDNSRDPGEWQHNPFTALRKSFK